MVLNNETIELINYSKDLDFDYNIKFCLRQHIKVWGNKRGK